MHTSTCASAKKCWTNLRNLPALPGRRAVRYGQVVHAPPMATSSRPFQKGYPPPNKSIRETAWMPIRGVASFGPPRL
jgi:hypothetical protein